MRFYVFLLMAFLLTPIVSSANSDKTVIDVYQETIQKLNAEYEKLKQLSVDAQQKVTVFENEANRIKTLITDYEEALKTTTQQMEEKHEAKLKQIGKAYQESMAGEAKLTRLARESAQEDAKKTEALLDELGTTAEQVAKLTDAVSVSEDGNVGIGTTNPKAKLDIKGDAPVVRIWGQRGDDNATLQLREADSNYGFDLIYNGAPDNKLYIEAFNGGNSMGKHLTIERQAGNVGIGTTTPQYKLDVKGTIRGNNVSPSDERFKQNIHTLGSSLAKIAQVRGVSFNWKDAPKNEQIGLVAQEVEKVFPELVSTDSEGYKSIAYGKLTAVLIEAIKELQQQNETMAEQIKDLGK